VNLLQRFGRRSAPFRVRTRDGAEFLAAKGETLLEAALRAGLKPPYDCRSGACTTCRCRVLRGTAQSLVDRSYVLERADIEDRIFLACQTQIGSDVDLDWPMASTAAQACPGTVVGSAQLTPTVWRVWFSASAMAQAQPGQYISVAANRPGDAGSRQFSLVRVDRAHRRDTLLHIDIARRPAGALSPWLTSDAARGAPVSIRGPFGNCVPDAGTGPLLALGAGSGIGAAAGVLALSRRLNPTRPTALLAYASSMQGLYACEPTATDRRAGQTPHLIRGWVRQPAPSRPGVHFGRAPAGLLDTLRDVSLPRPAGAAPAAALPLVLLYGPPGFVDACVSELATAGLPPECIRSDPYHPGETAHAPSAIRSPTCVTT
jgi:ferredoxin-NADP reductase/ferredoxin